MPITKEQAKALIKVHGLDAIVLIKDGLLATGKGPIVVKMCAEGCFMIRKERS